MGPSGTRAANPPAPISAGSERETLMNADQRVDSPQLSLPPVHPKCRIFDSGEIARYVEKLKASGNGAVLVKLGGALLVATGLSDLSKVFESRRN